MDLIQRLKNDILFSRLPKGVPLRQTQLSELYCVSRIPIRDALLSLKAEGWLIPHGKAGVMVPNLSWEEAEDLYLMRSQLESLILTKAFEKISEEDINKARGFLSELKNTKIGLLEKGRLNWAFHEAIYRAANRPTLLQMVRLLNTQAIRYLGFQYGPLEYQMTSDTQHEELLILIEKQDKKAAVTLLKDHIEIAGALLVNYLKIA